MEIDISFNVNNIFVVTFPDLAIQEKLEFKNLEIFDVRFENK